MPSLVVHAGAWDIPDAEVADHRAVVERAMTAGWDVLVAGGPAVAAVEAAVVVLEDDPATDAGTGSLLTAEGTVQLDAAMMRASDLAVGAVATVTRLANPITVARLLLSAPETMLTGEGAERFASAHGIEMIENQALVVDRERGRWAAWKASAAASQAAASGGGAPGDTVGAIALDAAGELVAGVSTGGVPFAPMGRVGDVPLVGCGFHAVAGVGAAVSTGEGEAITRVGLARTVTELLAGGAGAGAAAQAAVEVLGRRVGGRGGVIVVDHAGRPGTAHSTGRMARGWISDVDRPARPEVHV